MTAEHPEIGGRYAKYVLLVLVIVYVFNFVDRQVLSILAEEIKADLGISDAEMGFLYGTAFAVFYSVFGIPLGKLADSWNRKSLIAIGLSFWSLMTALSGTASSFATLALLRFGVGIGEASATPAAFSLLSDYFAPRVRGTVLALYSCGGIVGVGLGMMIGGVFVDTWNATFPENPPFGLSAWRGAFIAVGLPGLFIAVWVASLREPQRGISEGLIQPENPNPFRTAFEELVTILPPLTLISAARQSILGRNLVALLVIALIAASLIRWLGSPAQWIALGVGIYATVSWVQVSSRRDPVAFELMFRSRAFVFSVLGFALLGFPGYGIGFWIAPYMLRVHGVATAEAGTLLGIGAALGGLLGITFWGLASDRLRRRTQAGRLYIGVIVAAGSAPLALSVLFADSPWQIYLLFFLFNVMASGQAGPGASTINDLVLPRMRAVASAFYLLCFTFAGAALGPYIIGQVSDALTSTGLDSGEALRRAMLAAIPIYLITAISLAVASRYLAGDEASRLERARAAGEPV